MASTWIASPAWNRPVIAISGRQSRCKGWFRPPRGRVAKDGVSPARSLECSRFTVRGLNDVYLINHINFVTPTPTQSLNDKRHLQAIVTHRTFLCTKRFYCQIYRHLHRVPRNGFQHLSPAIEDNQRHGLSNPSGSLASSTRLLPRFTQQWQNSSGALRARSYE